MFNESKIKYKFLNISFINKSYIGNYNSNYEIYLNEFLNVSKFASNKCFVLNELQNNGQCDSSNGEYELEFKLFIDKNEVEKLNNHSGLIEKNIDNVIIYKSPKEFGEYTLTNLKYLLSLYSLDELNYISNNKRLDKNEAKVRRFLNKLRIDKNLLFLIPAFFDYYDEEMNDEYLQHIINKFSKELQNIFLFRKQHSQLDLYISFFVEGYIVFTKLINNKLVYFDKVEICKSPKFIEIYEMAYPFNELGILK